MDMPLGLRSATELTAMLRAKEVSSRELLAHYSARLDALDGDINAVVTRDLERADRVAAQADELLAADSDESGRTRSLLGLPMTMKDALATEGMRSTGGAVELRDHVPDTDAEVVARVRQAGAVIFGKTNLPRWSADAQATNEIFGTTNNPWDLRCGPGGSSGGAAAAVSAGLTGADLGTDIGGSVRLPAHFSGVCGHKPSFGIVPQLGYISHPTYPTSEPDVNVIGPIARSVDDLELLLDVIVGPRNDLASAWSFNLPPSRSDDVDTLRIAAHLDDPFVRVSTEVRVALEAACDALEADGLTIDRSAWPAGVPFSDVVDVGLPLISAATSPGRTDDEFESMREIAANPDAASESLLMRARATLLYHRDWHKLVEQRDQHRHRWADFFQGVDVLLAPVAHVAAFEHQHHGTLYDRTLDVDGVERPYTEVIMWTSQFGYVGLPSTVVPVGLTPRGVPVGIQVVGPHLGDRTTLTVARRIEQALGGYQVPPIAVG